VNRRSRPNDEAEEVFYSNELKRSQTPRGACTRGRGDPHPADEWAHEEKVFKSR